MEIASHDTDSFLRMEKLQTPRTTFEAQGETHGDIDLRLVNSIEDLLVPILGRWENSDVWFHQLDFYGDGVRSLTFRRAAFPYAQVKSLQQLLHGEHAPFCILCIATDTLAEAIEQGGPESEDDYLAIFSSNMLATKTIAAQVGEA